LTAFYIPLTIGPAEKPVIPVNNAFAETLGILSQLTLFIKDFANL
jgi:hypothetical protein